MALLPPERLPVVDTRNYAFIDGNYLRRAYEDVMRRVFPKVTYSDLHLPDLQHALQASKVFYYDAVDEEAADAREREDYLDHINALDGFHVRKGTITGSKDRKRQKRVDVQLAVECLMHAYNKTIWHATIVAGDLDFEPLVSQLVNLGVHVHVYYERASGAKKLYRAADAGVAMRILDFWRWSTEDFQKTNPLPEKTGQITVPPYVNVRRGMWHAREVSLWRNSMNPTSRGFAIEAEGDNDRTHAFRYFDNDKDRLLRFIELQFGTIEWLPGT